MTNPMEIDICWGPEDTWRSSAMECAGGFFTAAQQQLGGFLRVYEEIVDESTVMPITLHVSAILVNKGNPKGIESINDLFIPNQNIKLVVNDGNYHDNLTSATGLWEDVVGRSFNGSGDARDTLLGTNPDVDEQADAWITWNDWTVANSDVFDEIPIDLRYIIARDVSIIATDKTSESNVVLLQQFCDFLQSDDDDVNAAMQSARFHKSWAFSSP
ncbi:hypothetical protein SARC_05462 [Sphaeroforma arctica JP610]|uniref:Uncharacterized protein n=1 Tax=Sphaeroforma arctica JP610 TaxID=667725 RepID=A0A0L0FZK8_9EUKA|nr:hypothetical protein SARC_05462 [Sphaeroforma arctica JP610]KNC82255.1 hypothetical protein SARC_05462 [Sphaeroforma arctica JP610]|eukprot:XP_014156157.1 hypothetical protein SARC_05462 [Sphaeroforma arctica JP610]